MIFYHCEGSKTQTNASNIYFFDFQWFWRKLDLRATSEATETHFWYSLFRSSLMSHNDDYRSFFRFDSTSFKKVRILAFLLKMFVSIRWSCFWRTKGFLEEKFFIVEFIVDLELILNFEFLSVLGFSSLSLSSSKRYII